MKPNQNPLAPQQNRQFLKMCFWSPVPDLEYIVVSFATRTEASFFSWKSSDKGLMSTGVIILAKLTLNTCSCKMKCRKTKAMLVLYFMSFLNTCKVMETYRFKSPASTVRLKEAIPTAWWKWFSSDGRHSVIHRDWT